MPTRSTARSNETTRPTLVVSAHATWREALVLKDSMDAWDQLRVPLARYSNVQGLFFTWYRDSLLAACRRLLDDRKDVASVIRALRLNAHDAPSLTNEVLEAYWDGHPHEEAFRGDAPRKIARATGGEEILTRRAVNTAIDGLLADHKKIVDLTNSLVSHRPSRRADLSATFDEIGALVDDVLDVVQAWTSLLAQVHLVDDPPGVSGLAALVTALELFDWLDYMKAKATAEREIHPAAPPEVFDALGSSASLIYKFDPAPEEWRWAQ